MGAFTLRQAAGLPATLRGLYSNRLLGSVATSKMRICKAIMQRPPHWDPHVCGAGLLQVLGGAHARAS
jgi:hypothetical protein